MRTETMTTEMMTDEPIEVRPDLAAARSEKRCRLCGWAPRSTNNVRFASDEDDLCTACEEDARRYHAWHQAA
jgi:hypothetical protein